MELLSLGLKQLGINNSIYSHFCPSITKFSHVIHFSTVNSSASLIHAIRGKHNCKIYLWPLYWPSNSRPKPLFDYLKLFDGIILKSKSEGKVLFDGLDMVFDSNILLPLFVNNNYFDDTSQYRGIFKSLYNLDKYNLWVGQIAPEKGQLEFINTIKDLNQKFVFIGNYSDEKYYQLCLNEGSRNCLFVDDLPQASELLISAFLDCSNYVELSKEPAGTSALEASKLSCRILASRDSWSEECLQNNATLVDPSDKLSILNFFKSSKEDYVNISDKNNITSISFALSHLVNSIRI